MPRNRATSVLDSRGLSDAMDTLKFDLITENAKLPPSRYVAAFAEVALGLKTLRLTTTQLLRLIAMSLLSPSAHPEDAGGLSPQGTETDFTIASRA